MKLSIVLLLGFFCISFTSLAEFHDTNCNLEKNFGYTRNSFSSTQERQESLMCLMKSNKLMLQEMLTSDNFRIKDLAKSVGNSGIRIRFRYKNSEEKKNGSFCTQTLAYIFHSYLNSTLLSVKNYSLNLSEDENQHLDPYFLVFIGKSIDQVAEGICNIQPTYWLKKKAPLLCKERLAKDLARKYWVLSQDSSKDGLCAKILMTNFEI